MGRLIMAALAIAALAGETALADEDPYLWLDEVEGARALEWVEAQNTRSLEELEGDARFSPLFEEAKAILNSQDRIPYGALRKGYVYNFWRDPANPRGLWRRASLESYRGDAPEWDTILDIDALAEAEGENWVYAGTNCLAPDYDRCIVSLSRGGSDAAVRREFLISEKRFVEDGFIVPESKSRLDWADEDTLFIGADVGENALTESGYPRTIRRWSRGTKLEDAPIVFEGEASDVSVGAFTDLVRGERIAGIVRADTFFTREYFLLEDDGPKKLPLPAKSGVAGMLPGRVIATLQEDWTYKGETYPSGAVIAYLPKSDKVELVFAAGERQSVNGVSVSENFVYVTLLDDVVGRVITLRPTWRGWAKKSLDLPDNGEVAITNIEAEGDDLFVNFESPIQPASLYYFKAKGRGFKRDLIKSAPGLFDAAGVVVERRSATSKDGTEVPFFVIGKKGVIEAGDAPVVQYGYGGFEVALTPGYSAVTGKLWIEQGGVYVISNIRGGGEFGPDWHQAALKDQRHKAYEDFFAIGEALVSSGLTSPQKLGALGGSNGGLLMGAAFTQRPDLYNAIGCGVPLLDMLRYHKLLAGASWIAEYGDPDIPEERAYLETYSPYQAVREDADYPRVFFFTSTKDDRVHPGHARKTSAKFEAMGHPFLYYENTEGGHGAAANQDQRARLSALEYVYFMRQLSADH